MMKKISATVLVKGALLFSLFTFSPLSASAQRIGCLVYGDRGTTRSSGVSLPEPMDFDPQKTYRMPIVLVSFDDTDFTMSDPKSYYQRVFNEEGYNEGAGLGCMADYFREQSGGRLNMQFDIYGPFKVSQSAGGHGTGYYGTDVIADAIQLLNATETPDFSIYDWDGDGEINQVFFVAAGYGGNQVAGYIWPNSQFLSYQFPGNKAAYFCSIATELWEDGSLNGFGTIAHEICHGLGLPDIYPLGTATSFSAVDEWDLLDGGNNTNRGWCPPNLMAMEKMYLGWDQPEELTQATSITDMKSVSAGGKSYLIRNSGQSNEFYLLENRQQEGWDYGCPGNGLIIVHVDFQQLSWGNNEVNISDTHYRYDLFHADGKDYMVWDSQNDGKDPNKYAMPDCLRCKYLSTSAYPFGENQSLTDTSFPAAVLFSPNADGELLMSKAITNIQVTSDGTVSFDFMTDPTAIRRVLTDEGHTSVWYDLQGRRLQGKPMRKGLYIHNRQKESIR